MTTGSQNAGAWLVLWYVSSNLNARKSSGIAQIRNSNSWGWGELVWAVLVWTPEWEGLRTRTSGAQGQELWSSSSRDVSGDEGSEYTLSFFFQQDCWTTGRNYVCLCWWERISNSLTYLLIRTVISSKQTHIQSQSSCFTGCPGTQV